jgi:hypothetical protein
MTNLVISGSMPTNSLKRGINRHLSGILARLVVLKGPTLRKLI